MGKFEILNELKTGITFIFYNLEQFCRADASFTDWVPVIYIFVKRNDKGCHSFLSCNESSVGAGSHVMDVWALSY